MSLIAAKGAAIMQDYLSINYNWQLPDWPKWHWEQTCILEKLTQVRYQQGRLLGKMSQLDFPLQQTAILATLTEDVLKTSEIEGERLNKEQVRSSIARRLGLDVGGLVLADRHVEGVVEMMLDATGQFETSLTEERLFAWHAALFPTGHSGMTKITVGAWRDDSTGPMQVLSGPFGREKVHFQAPPAALLTQQMQDFLSWFNAPIEMDNILKAAISHIWFISIHPFDDGNGRIARAISDLCLARSEQSSNRFYSMSSQIQKQRNAYYDILEKTQKASMEITEWMVWFLECLTQAIQGAESTLSAILFKARFWEQAKHLALNKRQKLVLNRVLDGFEGKLTSSKWAKLAKCSPDTALRDINELIQHGLLKQTAAGGRSTSYTLKNPA